MEWRGLIPCIVIARNVNILDGTKIFEKVFKIASSIEGAMRSGSDEVEEKRTWCRKRCW